MRILSVVFKFAYVVDVHYFKQHVPLYPQRCKFAILNSYYFTLTKEEIFKILKVKYLLLVMYARSILTYTAQAEITETIFLNPATPLCIIFYPVSFSSLLLTPHTGWTFLLLTIKFKHQFVCLSSNFLGTILEIVVKRHRFCMHCVPFIMSW